MCMAGTCVEPDPDEDAGIAGSGGSAGSSGKDAGSAGSAGGAGRGGAGGASGASPDAGSKDGGIAGRPGRRDGGGADDGGPSSGSGEPGRDASLDEIRLSGGGCGCNVPGRSHTPRALGLGLLLIAAVWRRRRARQQRTR